MIDTVQKLLEKNFFSILESTPSACLVLVDTVGHWHLDDFDIVWFNPSAKKLFGDIISRGKVNVSSNEKFEEILEDMQLIRQQLISGREGFIGPFSSTIANSEGQSTIIDRYTLYLGEIGSSSPTFLVLAHGRIVE